MDKTTNMILSIIMLIIILFIIWYGLIRKPEDGCRWWQHKYKATEVIKEYPTGDYVGNMPIITKRKRWHNQCEKCGYLAFTDEYPLTS